MLEAAAAIVASYLIGIVPIAYLTGRFVAGVDVRDVGSGNVGASNIWQSVSKTLVVPVGLAQIAQGLAAVLLAKAVGLGSGGQALCGIVVLIANDWNPLLRFAGGRGVGQTIGVLLALAPWALAAFIIVALAGVALRAIPQFVALALLVTPIAAALSGEPAAAVAGCAAIAVIAMLKRLAANGAPDASCPRPEVAAAAGVRSRRARSRGVGTARRRLMAKRRLRVRYTCLDTAP